MKNIKVIFKAAPLAPSKGIIPNEVKEHFN